MPSAAGSHCQSNNGPANAAAIRRRAGHNAPTTTGAAVYMPSRVMLAPSGFGMTTVANAATAYSAAPTRTVAYSRGNTSAPTSPTSAVIRKASSPNGNVPPLGNARPISASAPPASSVIARPKRRSGRAENAQAVAASIRNTPATGLANAVSARARGGATAAEGHRRHGRHPDREAQRKRQAPDSDVGHGPSTEDDGCGPRGPQPAASHHRQAPCRHDGAQHRSDRDAEQRGQRRIEQRVAGRVVPAVPVVVPLREAGAVEQVDPVQLRGQSPPRHPRVSAVIASTAATAQDSHASDARHRITTGRTVRRRADGWVRAIESPDADRRGVPPDRDRWRRRWRS